MLTNLKSKFLPLAFVLLTTPSFAQNSQHWTELAPPLDFPALVCPYFINSDFGFVFRPAVVFGGEQFSTLSIPQLSRTTDGGQTWTLFREYDTLNFGITQMYFVSPSHGYFSAITLDDQSLVYGSGGLYETLDSGLHWNKISKGIQSFNSVYAMDGLVLATEFTPDVSTGGFVGRLVFTGDGGVTWKSLTKAANVVLGTRPQFLYVTGNKENLIATVLFDSAQTTYLVTSTNRGADWTAAHLDRAYPWNMMGLYFFPHSTDVIREFVPPTDEQGDTYSFLRSSGDYQTWKTSIVSRETGGWMEGSSCVVYLSSANNFFPGQGLMRSLDRGKTWSSVEGPTFEEIDDEDYQNLSVVGHGAVVYAADLNGNLWKTTDGGDGSLSANQFAPRFSLQHELPSGSTDTLFGATCDSALLTVYSQNISCSLAKLQSISIDGLDPNEYRVSSTRHVLSDNLPDTSLITVTPAVSGARPLTVHAHFIDDEFEMSESSFPLVLSVQPGTGVEVSLYLKPGAFRGAAGDTIDIPLYAKSTTIQPSAATAGISYQLNTDVIEPIVFVPQAVGVTASKVTFTGSDASVTLQLQNGLPPVGESILGSLRCRLMLSDTLTTTVLISSVTLSSSGVHCLASSQNTNSVQVLTRCGDASLMRFMMGSPVGTIASVAPNPTNGSAGVHLINPEHKTIEYEVFDALGIRQLSGSTSNKELNLDLHLLRSGSYYLRTTSASGAPSTRRIVLQK